MLGHLHHFADYPAGQSLIMIYRAVVWVQGGCIIRAGFLDDIKNAYKRNPDLENLVLDDWFAKKLAERQDAWRDVVKIAITNGRSSVHAALPCVRAKAHWGWPPSLL